MKQETKREVSQEIRTEATQKKSKDMRKMIRGTANDNRKKHKPKITVISAVFLSDFKLFKHTCCCLLL
jgi:hypothetical protein